MKPKQTNSKNGFTAKIRLFFIALSVIVLYFSAEHTYSSYVSYSEMKTITESSIITEEISNLVHEIQKERGYTAAFVGSNKAKFETELQNQKQATNKKKAILELSSSLTFDDKSFSPQIIQSLRKSMEMVSGILQLRKKLIN